MWRKVNLTALLILTIVLSGCGQETNENSELLPMQSAEIFVPQSMEENKIEDVEASMIQGEDCIIRSYGGGDND